MAKRGVGTGNEETLPIAEVFHLSFKALDFPGLYWQEGTCSLPVRYPSRRGVEYFGAVLAELICISRHATSISILSLFSLIKKGRLIKTILQREDPGEAPRTSYELVRARKLPR